MSVQILKSFTFVPQPKFNGDPLLIKRERCLITDAGLIADALEADVGSQSAGTH